MSFGNRVLQKRRFRLRFRLLPLLFCGLSCFAGTLRGVISAEDGRPLSGAKVVVFSDVAMILVQRGVSDRRGLYQFNLEPGSYRIFVIKEGYEPVTSKALVKRDKETVVLHHDLFSEMAVSENDAGKKLKRILRRSNREPYRDVQPFYRGQTRLTRQSAPSAGEGRAYTESGTGLHGSETTEGIAVATRLNETLVLRSDVAGQQRSDHETLKVAAGLDVETSAAGLGFDVERLSGEGAGQVSQGTRVALEADYGDQFAGRSVLIMEESRTPLVEERHWSVQQVVSFPLLDGRTVYDFQHAAFEQPVDQPATRDHVEAAWHRADEIGRHLRVDLTRVALDGSTVNAGSVWVGASFSTPSDRLSLVSQVGYHNQSAGDGEMQHDHRFYVGMDRFYFDASYLKTSVLDARNMADTFGRFLFNPAVPFLHQGFYSEQHEQLSLGAGMVHYGWRSHLTWSLEENAAVRLDPLRQALFLEQAEVNVNRVAYALSSPRGGSALRVSLNRQERGDLAFSQALLSYVHSFKPFKGKDQTVSLALNAANQPDIPGWWLLTDVPWNPESEEPWFEGRLSISF